MRGQQEPQLSNTTTTVRRVKLGNSQGTNTLRVSLSQLYDRIRALVRGCLVAASNHRRTSINMDNLRHDRQIILHLA